MSVFELQDIKGDMWLSKKGRNIIQMNEVYVICFIDNFRESKHFQCIGLVEAWFCYCLNEGVYELQVNIWLSLWYDQSGTVSYNSLSCMFLSESLSMKNLPEVWKVEVKQKSLISEGFSNERDR